MKTLLEQYIFDVKELNDTEIMLCGGYLSDTKLIIKKEWISWIINSIRNMTQSDFYNPDTFITKESEDSHISIMNTLKDRDFSILEIYVRWNDKNKRAPAFSMPYPAGNENRIMAYIEPVLCELSKFLTEEEQKKLAKPWSCNMNDEEWAEYKSDSQKNGNTGDVRFIGEINPKEYFGSR